MKKKTSLLTVLVLLLVGILSACQPAGYSEDKQKEVTEAHKGDGVAWFAKNRPEVSAKEGKAYADGTDLFAVIQGTYKVGKQEYTYLYDYDGDIMYTTEKFQAVTDLCTQNVVEALGISAGSMDLRFYRDLVYATCLNDKQDPSRPAGEGFVYAGVLPESVKVESFAAATMRGETEVHSYVTITSDEIPTPSENFFSDYAELLPVKIQVPVTKDYQGVCRYDLNADGIGVHTLYLTDLGDGLTAGYVIPGECNEIMGVDRSTEGVLVLSIPREALLILIYEGDGQPYILLDNGNGEMRNLSPTEALMTDSALTGYKKVSTRSSFSDLCLALGKEKVYWFGVESRFPDGVYPVTIGEKKK